MIEASVPGYVVFPTSIGNLALLFEEDGLAGVALPAQTEATTIQHLLSLAPRGNKASAAIEAVALEDAPPPIREAASRITAHLAGETGADADLGAIELSDRRLTPFRKRVYEEARRIPRGELASYAEIAERAGSPGAARAVGRAMATNPWPLVVPCHRVVSAEGALHGFSAPGGTRTKAALLKIEGYAPRARGDRPVESVSASDSHPDGHEGQGVLPFGSAPKA